MKKIVFYLFAALAAVAAASCEHKELCYDHTHTVEVRVVFDWKNAPEAAPETMSLYLFPKTGGEPLRYEFTDRRGGTITVPFGAYDALGLNSDTETLLFRNIALSGTFEVYTREANLLGALGIRSEDAPRAEGAQDERVAAQPDMLWCDSAKDIDLKRDVSGQTITLYPAVAVRNYTVEIRNAENLKYVTGLSGSLSGMAAGLLVESKAPTSEAVTLPFAAAATEELTGITGGLQAFGPCSAERAQKLVIYAVLGNGEKWYYTYDVTEQVREAPDPYNVHILLDGLPLPKPLVNGGGFQPGVDGWNEIFIDIIL